MQQVGIQLKTYTLSANVYDNYSLLQLQAMMMDTSDHDVSLPLGYTCVFYNQDNFVYSSIFAITISYYEINIR